MTLPSTITIRPADTYAHWGTDPGSPTAGYLRYWMPILGPTTTLAYRYLLEATDEGRAYGYIDLEHLALDLGIGHGIGPHSPLTRAWHRLRRFGLLFDAPDLPGIADLPIHVPWLEARHLDRIRPDLAILERRHRQALQEITHLHDEP